MRRFAIFVFFLGCALAAGAARKPHSIVFGNSMQVKWFTGPDQNQARQIQVRALYVDSRLREFTTGEPHQVTERMFVVRQALRVNDQLPDDKNPRWKWDRGAWLLVNRQTGHIGELKLPQYDAFYSAPAWYRGYVAYCGVSSDGGKLYAVLMEIGVKKPLIKEELGGFHGGNEPDSACPAPEWQRQPARVTFRPPGSAALSFEVHENTAEAVAADSSNSSANSR